METILANLPMALCLLLGMGLIIVEVFLPGFGLPGVAGIALVGVGTIMAAMHFGSLTAVALLLVIIAVLAVLISWLLRSAAKGDMGKSKLFLHQKDELCDQQQDMQVFVGHEGKTLSVLRPSGIGDFDGVRLNVVPEVEFIENGTPICETADSCSTLPIWKGLSALINNYLNSITLADAVNYKDEGEDVT